MKLVKKAGATSEIWQVFIQDTSKFDGSGLTGLTNASSGLTAYYHRDTDTTATAISLVSMTVGTFTSSGFKEIDATNMPGWYQFCPPNAALASGAKSCAFLLKGATNMAAVPIEVQLTAVDADSATAFITGVNSVAPPTNWNLLSVDSNGRVDVIKINGTSQTARDLGASVLLSSGTGTGQLDFTSGVVKANTTQVSGTTQTARDLGASVLLSSGTGTGQLDFTSGVVKANATQFAGQTITAAAGVTLPATVASTTNITAGTITTVTNLTNAPTAGDFTATMKTSLNDATPSVTVSDKTGFSLSSAGVQAIWDALTSGLTTAASIGKLLVDNVNATIGSRSTYAGTDTAGTTTLLSRIASALTITSGKVDVNDKTGFALTSAYDPAKTAAQAGDAMALTSGERTSTGTAVWASTTRELTSGANIVLAKGTGVTGFNDLSAAQVNAEADTALADAGVTTTVTGRIDAAISSRSSHSAADVWAVGTRALTDKANFTLASAYDAAKTAAQAGDAMALTSGERTATTATVWDAATSGLTTSGSIGKRLADDIDAAVSSRSTYAGADTPGTTTLLGRVTATRAGNLDHLDADVSSRSTYAGVDTSGTTTLLARLTSTRAALLDNLDALISSRLAASSYTAPANATIASIYAAVDTEIATILTAVAAIQAQTDLLPASPAATGDAMTLTSGERNAIADAHLDRADAIETGLTVRGAHRLEAAAAAGKASGMADNAPVFRNAVADSKDRIIATTTADGDRLTVDVDLT